MNKFQNLSYNQTSKQHLAPIIKFFFNMEDIKKLKKDTKLVLQNTILPSPKKVNGSSSDSIDYGKQKNESSSKSLINI